MRTDLTWGSAGTEEPGDQTADSRIQEAGCTSMYWLLGPTADGQWEVQLIGQNFATGGEDVPTAGIDLGHFASEVDAKGAAQQYENAAWASNPYVRARRFDERARTYLAAVWAALVGGVPLRVAPGCTECGTASEAVDDPIGLDEALNGVFSGGWPHVVAPTADGRLFVVIGCEGYWLVDPNSVGVASPNWQDWAKP